MAKNKVISFTQKSLVTVAILAAIVGVLVYFFKTNIEAMGEAGKMMGPPPVAVATADVSEMEWPVESAAIGTITPVQGVTLSVEVPGTITELSFESGQPVQQGDVLAKLDSRSERAQLSAAEAASNLAKLSLDRSKQLLERKTISQAEFDAADAEYKQALANVQNIKSAIDKKEIVAPFDGRLGIRRINLGQYLNAGEAVVSLQSIDPIYVSFYLPQKELAYLKVGLPVQTTSDAFPGQQIIGEISALAAEVDASSRMIEVQATLPNPDGLLAAGMFVNVRIEQADPRPLQAVPASSVLYASYGNSIYTVIPVEGGQGYTASQKFVKLGERRGDFVEVIEGLELNERVVTDGAFKLYPGASLILQDERAPVAQLNPVPTDS
jgi:membrane fusion protein (multidrug efflux system)